MGVTLVELIITIAVIAILVTLMAPSMYRSQQRADARSLSNEIAQQIRAARNRAMSRNEAVWVDFDLGTSASDRGSIAFRRTKTMCSDGTIAATCSGGATASRARNCRMAPASTTDYETISVYNLNRESGSSVLLGRDPDIGSICINSDGRIYDEDGVVISGGTVPCTGENLALWVAREGTDTGTAETAATCNADPIEREKADIFVIRVPFNGAVEVKQ